MYPAEVVVHEMEGNSASQVFNLLRKGIGQPGKAAHVHAHR
jgi:hypothetical protein